MRITTHTQPALFQAWNFILASVAFSVLAGCASKFSPTSLPSIVPLTATQIDEQAIAGLGGVRVSFADADYFSPLSPNPSSACAGDAKIYYNPYELNGSMPTAFPASQNNADISVHPHFVKNVSVDLTNSNSTDALNLAFGCSLGTGTDVPPLSKCATFDNGLFVAPEMTDALGSGTGYYSMFDYICDKAGPISTTDPVFNKLLAGGAYIDLDRNQLGVTENLLLNLTYIPMDATSFRAPAATTRLTNSEAAFFKIHLVKTGLTLTDLWLVLQPRYLTYSDTTRYPEIVKSFAIISPPTNQVRQEQLVLPISMDPSIDRIRIERYSGTGILVEASLYRMGIR